MSVPRCTSAGDGVCKSPVTNEVVTGYSCENSQCTQCSVGEYGPNGKICLPCPYATWAPLAGTAQCQTTFTFPSSGLHKLHIPFGVNIIQARMWGAGGASDSTIDPTYISHAGGGGGYSQGNVSVVFGSNINIIVGGGGTTGSTSFNPGGFGGGGAGFGTQGYSSGGGGGRSALQIKLGQDVVTASGGGGGSDCLKGAGCGGGGGGGDVGRHGVSVACGRGGTAFEGGAPGVSYYCSGTAGSQYQGGNGCKNGSTAISAGGGGGYFGGGGGSAYGGDPSRIPYINDQGGGGGGGYSYGDGCETGTYTSLTGDTGSYVNASKSGGWNQAFHTIGVGVGGAPGGLPGGTGLVVLTYIANLSASHLTPDPSGQPTSLPTGQPSLRPSARPTVRPSTSRPSYQPSSTPTRFVEKVALAQKSDVLIGTLTTKSTIIVFSLVGSAVLLISVFLTCYFHYKYHKDEKDQALEFDEEEKEFDEDDKNYSMAQEKGGMLSDEDFGKSSRTLGEDGSSQFTPPKLSRLEHLSMRRSSRSGNKSFLSDISAGSDKCEAFSRSLMVLGELTPTGLGVNPKRGVSLDLSINGPSRVDPLTRRRSMNSNTVSGGDDLLSGSVDLSTGLSARVNPLRRNVSLTSQTSRLGRDNSLREDDPLRRRASLNSQRSGSGGNDERRRISQVTVTSFTGKGNAPRLTRLQNFYSGDGEARERFIKLHGEDVLLMTNFFKQAGLGIKSAKSCAEEAIYLDANSPRQLFKYVHEVEEFSLIHLGMDNIDATLVLEFLNGEFTASDISPAAAAKKAVELLMRGSSRKKDLIDSTDEARIHYEMSFLNSLNQDGNVSREGSEVDEPDMDCI